MLFELAYHLKMPVYQLENEMPYTEYQRWFQYFEARPPGWRADNAAATVAMSNGVKVKPDQMFSSLAQMKKWERTRTDAEAAATSFKGSVFGAMFDKATKKG